MARSALLLSLLLGHLALLSLAWPGRLATAPAPARRLPTWLLPARLPPVPAPTRPARIEPAQAVRPAETQTAHPVRPESPTVPATAAETGGAAEGQAEAPTSTPAGPAPLRLGLPGRGPSTRAQSPALVQQMLSDPRSNTPRLSASERFAIALGTLDCVIDERQPDGSVLRLEGRLSKAPASSNSLDPFGHASSTGGGFGDRGTSLGGNAIAGRTVMVCVKK